MLIKRCQCSVLLQANPGFPVHTGIILIPQLHPVASSVRDGIILIPQLHPVASSVRGGIILIPLLRPVASSVRGGIILIPLLRPVASFWCDSVPEQHLLILSDYSLSWHPANTADPGFLILKDFILKSQLILSLSLTK